MIHAFLSRVPPKIDPDVKRGTMKQRCNWEEVARRYSGMMKKALRKYGGPEQYDINESIMRRRERALVKYTPVILERYRDLPGYAPEWMDETGEKFIDYNLTPANTYNRMEPDASLLLAASVWILDEVMATDTDRRDALYRLLPRDETALEEVHNPQCFWHAAYEDTLVESVQHVLQYRNRDVAPVETEADDTERFLTSALTADGRQHADVPSRRAFEQLMALIPRESADRAAAYFESLFWQWTDRFFACLEPLILAKRDLSRQAEELLKPYNRMRRDLIAIAEEFDRRIASGKSPAQPFSPVLSSAAPVLPLASFPGEKRSRFPVPSKDTDLNRYYSLIDSMVDLGKRHFDLKHQARDEGSRIYDFFEDMMLYGCLDDHACREKYGDAVADRMRPLRIEKPFEACFGLLWLIESGSDLPWLYGCGCGLMEEVAESLPWGVFDYEEEHDTVWWPDVEEEAEETEKAEEAGEAGEPEQAAPEAASAPEREAPAAVSPEGWPAVLAEEWYERKFRPKAEEGFSSARSLAQIVYEETGCILPRDLRMYAGRKRNILDYGVSDGEADFLQFLFSVLGQARRSRSALNFEEVYMRILDAEAAGVSVSSGLTAGPAEEEEDPQLTAEQLQELLKAEQEKNRQLRDSLHASEKSARAARQELASAREEADLERRELADLRELVFNAASGEEETDAPETVDESRYPCEVRKQTVVFGGHSSWLKAIRQMLTGNVRFIDRDPDFSPNVIRNADIVWVQTNALSHSMFYKIADTARRYHKPVRYFSWASAARCARQVLEADA